MSVAVGLIPVTGQLFLWLAKEYFYYFTSIAVGIIQSIAVIVKRSKQIDEQMETDDNEIIENIMRQDDYIKSYKK